MSRILAIETSTRFGGTAIATENGIEQVRRFDREKPASENLIPFVQDMLRAQSMKITDLEAIAVSIGPGSFTGLRVGLTMAKTVGYLLRIPILPVSSLMALAFGAGCQSDPVAAVLDAKKREVYGAFFSVSGAGITRLSEDVVMSIHDFLSTSPSDRIHAIGDAVPVYRDDMDRSPITISFADDHVAHPSPERIASVALLGPIQPVTDEAILSLKPVYLRRSEAEVNWEKKFGTMSGSKT